MVIGFQTDRTGGNAQIKNPSEFDHCEVQDIYVVINSVRYPAVGMKLNFTGRRVSQAYKMLAEFKASAYGLTEASCQITPLEFIARYPLFVLDLRRQPERLKNSVQDITLKAEFLNAVGANTIAYALMISDRLLHLKSDGSKFDLIY